MIRFLKRWKFTILGAVLLLAIIALGVPFTIWYFQHTWN